MERVSVISFNHAQPEMPMVPIWEAPLLKDRGPKLDSGIYGPLHKAQEEGQAVRPIPPWEDHTRFR